MQRPKQALPGVVAHVDMHVGHAGGQKVGGHGFIGHTVHGGCGVGVQDEQVVQGVGHVEHGGVGHVGHGVTA